jgi:hypothetical protein
MRKTRKIEQPDIDEGPIDKQRYNNTIVKAFALSKKKLAEEKKPKMKNTLEVEVPKPVEDKELSGNFHSESMTDIDVVENILDKFTKSGITHKFQGPNIIITALTYSRKPQAFVKDDLKKDVIEAIKILKDEYKNAVDKTLKLGKAENEDFDCVTNYTTNRLALCRYTCSYKMTDSKAEEDDGTKKDAKSSSNKKN